MAENTPALPSPMPVPDPPSSSSCVSRDEKTTQPMQVIVPTARSGRQRLKGSWRLDESNVPAKVVGGRNGSYEVAYVTGNTRRIQHSVVSKWKVLHDSDPRCKFNIGVTEPKG